MKRQILTMWILLAMPLLLGGHIVPATAATQQTENTATWWAEIKTLCQRAAHLKQTRNEEISALYNRLYKQAEQEVPSGQSEAINDRYDKLVAKAKSEFAAIRNHYNPQIAEALKQYYALLQKNQPSGGDVLPATTSLRPQVLYMEKAKYTETARQNRVQGTVLLEAVFRADGKIGKVEILRGLPDGLSEEAEKAARELIFVPANKEGKPVNVRMKLEYSFNLL